jgi:hypothetical protein
MAYYSGGSLMTVKPLFSVGDKVKHLGANVKCVVEDIINWDDMDDVLGFTDKDGDYHPGQGFRYIVRYRNKQHWSAPEQSLRLCKIK